VGLSKPENKQISSFSQIKFSIAYDKTGEFLNNERGVRLFFKNGCRYYSAANEVSKSIF
jgi:hypothetical protein